MLSLSLVCSPLLYDGRRGTLTIVETSKYNTELRAARTRPDNPDTDAGLRSENATPMYDPDPE